MLSIIVLAFVIVAMYGAIQKQNRKMEIIVNNLDLGEENLI